MTVHLRHAIGKDSPPPCSLASTLTGATADIPSAAATAATAAAASAASPSGVGKDEGEGDGRRAPANAVPANPTSGPGGGLLDSASA